MLIISALLGLVCLITSQATLAENSHQIDSRTLIAQADSMSAGDTGQQWRDTDQTGHGAWQDYTPGNFTARQGRSFTTGPQTRNAWDINGPMLPRATTGVYGRPSKPIPSGQYSFGFDQYHYDDNYYPWWWGDEEGPPPPPVYYPPPPLPPPGGAGAATSNTMGDGVPASQGASAGASSGTPSPPPAAPMTAPSLPPPSGQMSDPADTGQPMPAAS